jgi:adenylate cyclase
MWQWFMSRPSQALSMALGVLISLAMIVISGLDLTLANRARDAVHDAYLTASPRDFDPDAPVHIVDIDEASLALYGQWPWPRTYLAVLTEKLFAHGAIVIGFDILFAEADRTASATPSVPAPFSGGALAPPPLPVDSHDRRFADTLAAGPTVLGISGAANGEVPQAKAGISFTGEGAGATLTRYPSALTNLEMFTDAATGVGSVSLGVLEDGIIRSVPAVLDMGGELVPAFALELLRVAQGAGGYVLRTTDASGEFGGNVPQAVAIRVGAVEVPLEGNGHVRLNYAGMRDERMTSAARILQVDGIDPVLENAVAGRIVLIGSSAQSLFDIRATPLGQEVPGVVVHAEMIEQIAAGAFINRPDWARGAEVLAILVTGLLLTLALLTERPVLGLALAIILSTVSVVGSSALFAGQGWLLNPIFPALTALLIFLPGASLGFIMKERSRAHVRSRFAYFVPSEIVDEIADDPNATLTPKGADRELTVLFADMRGFTSATETMSPNDVVRYVNTFLSTVGDD